MTRHVVFGTGQFGRHVVEQLVRQGVEVVAVNRTGRGDLPGAEIIGGDATDPGFTTRAAAGAGAVYFCLNAANYARWADEFPPLQRGVLAAETRTTAQIVGHVYRLAGHRPRSFAAGRTALRLYGLVKPAIGEYLHTLYQFTDRWVVDDTKFRTAYGDLATPLDDALAHTLAWYRDADVPDLNRTARTGRTEGQ
jgi:hypothetical protein